MSDTGRFGPMSGRSANADRASVALLVSSGGYVAASLAANIMSVRAVSLGGWIVDAGTLTYPLTFTLRDVVHKVGGVRAARATVIATAGFNLLLALGIWATAQLPGAPGVSGPAQSAFGSVLLSTPRIIAASIIAQVLAEMIDTEVYRSWVRRFGHERQWGRVLVSNAISVPVDSVLFSAIAFAGVWPMSAVVAVIWSNIALKGLTSFVSYPLIYSVPDRSLDAEESQVQPTVT